MQPKEETATEAAEVKADAEEVKQEIADTKAEAAQARADGDPARANQLEERVDALTSDLSDIKKTLQKIADRPFAPAPAPKTKAEEPAGTKAEETAEEKKPKERVHRFGSRRWFGDRAYED